MRKALTKKDTKTDVAQTEFSPEELERLNQVVAKLYVNSQVDAVHALAAKFRAADGAGQALSLVTAAVAVTATECVRRATEAPYPEQRELELTSLNSLANAATKLTRAWDAHVNRNKNEVNVRDVNVAPGAQAVVGVVGLPQTPPTEETDTQSEVHPKKPQPQR
jgi:hypothetical protein